jgi:hypothetical protein
MPSFKRSAAPPQPDRVIDLSSWNAVRDQVGETLPSLLHRLPSADEARDTIVSGAQQALDRARGAAGSAWESLPSDMQDRMPKRSKKRGRSPLVTLAIVLVIAGGVFFLYRKFTGSSEEDWMTESWPEEPAPAAASFSQKPESDADAEKDAEESADVYAENPPPASVNNG